MERTYLTKNGDRWDTISQKAYGTPEFYPHIWEANKELLAQIDYPPLMPGGIRLILPDIEKSGEKTAEVPPWRK